MSLTTTRYSPLFTKAANRLTQARSVDSLKQGVSRTLSLWLRVDRLIERRELPLDEADAEDLRRQARYVLDTLENQSVLNDDQIEKIIEINRLAVEKLAYREEAEDAHSRDAAE